MSGAKRMVVFGAIVALFSATGCYAPDTETRTYRSPGGTYVIEAHGAFRRPTRWFVKARVVGRAVKDGASYAQLGVLREADRRDESFDELFSASVWDAPNVLHFFAGSQSPGACDTLVIANLADVSVRALKIAGDDLILGFDVLPRTETKVPLAPAIDPAGRHVIVESQSTSGEITHESRTLTTDRIKGPIQFEIRLFRNSISILPA